MLSLFVLSTLAASVAASSGNYTLPSGFDISKVDLAERNSWCTAERNSCPEICGGVAYGNACNPDTLDFTCTCVNKTAAAVEGYTNTIPYFVCQANYAQCIENHPDDADGQQKCKDDAKCGSKKPSAEDPSSSSTSSSSVASATPSSSDDDTPSTVASNSASATPSDSSSGAFSLTHEHSTGLLAASLFLAVRLIL